jgi:hypothetical protein
VYVFYYLMEKVTEMSCAMMSLGKRDSLHVDLVKDVARAFELNTANIFTAGGKVQVLLGQDTAALLLNKVDSKAAQATSCDFYEDISVFSSPVTPCSA